MTPDRWAEAERIYFSALARSGDERRVLVAEMCSGDLELRHEVETLLERTDSTGVVLTRTESTGAPRGPGQPDGHFHSSARNSDQVFVVDQVVAERFRIVRLVGTGGMGDVYEAEDLDLEERVALKTIRAEVMRDGAGLDRFRREIHLARQITHSNVCRVYDVFRHRTGSSEVVFLSMELLSGETLAERLQRTGRLTIHEALPVARQIGAGLNAIHAANIIHRDLKSSNVMLVESASAECGWRAVVTDFGLARHSVASGTTAFATEGGVLLGTPAYMAPEQVQGESLSAASDVYAFGVMLFEMTCGRLPFVAESALGVAMKRLYEAPPSPRDFVPDLPPVWERVILRCLEREPGARFSSAGKVVDALERRVPVPRPDDERDSSSQWKLLGAVAAVLVVGVAVGLWRWSTPAAPPISAIVPAAITTPAPASIPTVATPEPADVSALRRLSANALARSDFESALQSISEATTARSDDPEVQKDLDELLLLIRGNVGRAFQEMPKAPADPRALKDYRNATKERDSATSLAQAGQKIEAVRSLITAKQSLDRAGAYGRDAAQAAELKARTDPPPQALAAQSTQAPAPNTSPQNTSPQVLESRAEPTAQKSTTTEPFEKPSPQPAVAVPERSTQPSNPVVESLPPTDPLVADRKEIEAVLRRYTDAYERVNPAAIRQVWPSVPAALTRDLANVRSYRLELREVEIAIAGDTAQVSCVRQIVVQPAVGQRQSASPRTVISLQRRPTGWLITNVQ